MEDSTSADVADEGCLSCSSLRRAADLARQELHDARRSYHTALDVQRHLAAELEAALADHARRAAADRAELGAARERLVDVRAERDALVARLHAAHDEPRALTPPRKLTPPPNTPSPARDMRPAPVLDPASPAAAAAAALEAEALLTHAEAARDSARVEARALAARLAEAEEARAALRAAAEEREAEWLQTTALLRAQLHARNAADTDPQHAEKGNSLFAEVDDKRQEMARALLLMKQKNSQLRRSLAEARAEAAAAARRGGGTDLRDDHLQQLTESYAERVSVLEAQLECARRAAARQAAGGEGVAARPAEGRQAGGSARELATALQLWELRREVASRVTAGD